MKATWYEKLGPASQVLQFGDLPTPVPGQGEVRVKLSTSGVIPSDVKSRAARPLIAPRIIPHSDGAGVIDAVGPGVSPKRIGERVWIWNGQWKRASGTAAQWIALPEEQAVPLPDNVDFEAAACLGIPALTALRALTTDGPIIGKSVLVAGAAGAVGAYAVQFARLLGASQIIATVSTREKADYVAGLGADHVVLYRDEDVVERIQSLTEGRGVDRIVEVDASTNAKMLASIIAPDGLCAIYGSSKPEVSYDFGPMIVRGAGIRFFIVYELSAAARQETVLALNTYLRTGVLQHRIAKTYTLDQVAQAHLDVESGKLIGNVVIRCGE